MKGTDAPSDVHPHNLELYQRPTNYTQMMPYGSSEMFEHNEEYHKLLEAFESVFQWVTKVVGDWLLYVA